MYCVSQAKKRKDIVYGITTISSSFLNGRNRRTVYALAWSMAAVSADETSSKIKVCMHGGTIAEDTRRGKKRYPCCC
jgi:L-asparaginase/Glu-tRNA(Gln) amidotransferase subunit D